MNTVCGANLITDLAQSVARQEAEHLRTFLALPIDQDYPYGLGCYLTSKEKRNIKELKMEWGSDFDDPQTERNEMQGTAVASQKLQKLHTVTTSWAIVLAQTLAHSRDGQNKKYRMRECPKLVGNLPNSLSSLMKLEIVGRSELTAPLPRDIGQISNLSHIGEEFMGCLTALEDLSIKDCKEVRWLRLEKLEIWRSCQMKCKVLGSVTELIIRGCPKLVNILEKGWPPMLRKLHLFDCEGLEALPGDWMTMGMEGDNTNTLCLLESMQISSCPSLIFLPKGALYWELWESEIASRSHAKPHIPCYSGMWESQLPQHHMRNLTSLGKLRMFKCSGLVSFPEGGLGLALNLTEVEIEDCENLKTPQSEWGLHRLTSVTRLRIAPGRFQILESIACLPLQTLISLEYLHLYGCPKLQQFLPKEGLPATLGWLQIMRCPIIKKSSVQENFGFMLETPSLE
ncbi:putative disease resistance protein [Vitis vinifera]|uniref:Putative disease resistance protein n=1 Tax=Vitis vinifera TaxID=29760 RepID=A0A438FTP4_VITVI|nr:putative disease resistance protein [Vitis vinifera]